MYDHISATEMRTLINKHTVAGYKEILAQSIEAETRKIESMARSGCLNKDYDEKSALSDLRTVIKAKKIIMETFRQLEKKLEVKNGI